MVNKLKRILSVVLCVALLLSCLPAALAEDLSEERLPSVLDEPEIPDELIVGHPTITNGDFFTEMFGNNTSDIDVRALIHGYNLVNWDQNQGTYVFDPSVVREVVAVEDEEGNREYTMSIADNLFYSDGTPITAWDYAFSILLMMSPEIEDIGGKIYRADHLMGADRYIATRRKIIAGEPLYFDENDREHSDIDYLSGVTVLSDYQIRFWLNSEFLPYFFEVGLMMTVPYPISVIAPGCKVVSGYVDPETGDPIGIKIVNENENDPTPVYTAELLKKTILDPETGYNTHPSVVSGPYILTSWDPETHIGHFEINEYFKGAWMQNNLPGSEEGGNPVLDKAIAHGNAAAEVDEFGNEIKDANDQPIYLVKPTIEKIQLKEEKNEDMAKDLREGNVHLINKVTLADAIQECQTTGAVYKNYPRIGMAFLTYSYERPAVNDMAVRQAMAWCMDRDTLGQKYCGNFTWNTDGYYGLEQWEYQILEGFAPYPVNQLPSIDALGTKIDEKTEEDRAKKKKSHMWYETEEELEELKAAWDFLRHQWVDEEGNHLLVHYTVDLDEANKLLDKAGWTLNQNGEAYDAEKGDIRAKMINDKLEVLDLSIMYPQGNRMAEFMQEEGMFADNLAKVGIKVTFVPEPMESLLRYYYREQERTTDMIYLATNFHVIVDPSITYSADPTPNHMIWNNTYSDDEKLWELAVDMRQTEPGDSYAYVSKWIQFQKRYNEVLPAIPVYTNIYFDFWTPVLQNYDITKRVTWTQAILLAYFQTAEEAAAEEAAELEEGEEFFE